MAAGAAVRPPCKPPKHGSQMAQSLTPDGRGQTQGPRGTPAPWHQGAVGTHRTGRLSTPRRAWVLDLTVPVVF